MRKFIGIIIFIPLQTLFIPFAIIGAIITYYKQMYISKKLGVSFTAIEIINGRWTMDKFNLRKDPATVKLFNVLPNTSALGLWLALFPLYVLKQITGKPLLYPTVKKDGNETLANLVTSRTEYFDEILNKSLKNSEQFVVMGAGFDTRCYGPMAKNEVTLFELDKKNTQEFKKSFLHQTNIDTSNVCFVEVDFATESWYEKLSNAGYDKNKITTFLWEGVTLYLSEIDIRNTLKEIKKHAAPSSVIVADFYAKQFVNGDMIPGKKKSLEQLKMTNEELGFGIAFEGNSSKDLEALIKSENLKLGEVYYMGYKTKKGTWMAVAEVIV
jgi:methyltransferase (TIGR00027 family)